MGFLLMNLIDEAVTKLSMSLTNVLFSCYLKMKLLLQNLKLYKGQFMEGFYSEWIEEYRRDIENGWSRRGVC